MTAFDTDVMSDLLSERPSVVSRAVSIPVSQQYVPVVVAEELLRGWLNAVRQAEAGRLKVSLVVAYQSLSRALTGLRSVRLLPYTDDAETLVRDWRRHKVRVGIHDMRIAATAIVHEATLVTRNRRDFELIPGLKLEVWS